VSSDSLREDWGEAAVRPQASGTGRGPESSDSLREDWGEASGGSSPLQGEAISGPPATVELVGPGRGGSA